MNDKPKTVLLSRHHDITAFCSTNASRMVITGVHYNAEKKRLEATDGMALITVPIEGDGAESCIIPSKFFKSMVAKATAYAAKVASKVWLMTDLRKSQLGDSTRVRICVEQNDSESSATANAIEGGYPNIDMVWPSKEPVFTINVSGRFLKSLGTYAVAHGSHSSDAVKLEFFDPHEAVRFTIKLPSDPDGVGVQGLIMPMK